jgi:hypothetical protein
MATRHVTTDGTFSTGYDVLDRVKVHKSMVIAFGVATIAQIAAYLYYLTEFGSYFGSAGDDQMVFEQSIGLADHRFGGGLYGIAMGYLLNDSFPYSANVLIAYGFNVIIVTLWIGLIAKNAGIRATLLAFCSFPIFDTFTHLYRDQFLALMIVLWWSRSRDAAGNSLTRLAAAVAGISLRPLHLPVFFRKRAPQILLACLILLIYGGGAVTSLLVTGLTILGVESLANIVVALGNPVEALVFRALMVWQESNRPEIISLFVGEGSSFGRYYLANTVSSLLYPLSIPTFTGNLALPYQLLRSFAIIGNAFIVGTMVKFVFSAKLLGARDALYMLSIFLLASISFQYRHFTVFITLMLLMSKKIQNTGALGRRISNATIYLYIILAVIYNIVKGLGS